jgi:hypothetical protein
MLSRSLDIIIFYFPDLICRLQSCSEFIFLLFGGLLRIAGIRNVLVVVPNLYPDASGGRSTTGEANLRFTGYISITNNL